MGSWLSHHLPPQDVFAQQVKASQHALQCSETLCFPARIERRLFKK
jgi:hypothetical protein